MIFSFFFPFSFPELFSAALRARAYPISFGCAISPGLYYNFLYAFLKMVGFFRNLDTVYPHLSCALRSLMNGLLVSNTMWKTQSISINYEQFEKENF